MGKSKQPMTVAQMEEFVKSKQGNPNGMNKPAWYEKNIDGKDLTEKQLKTRAIMDATGEMMQLGASNQGRPSLFTSDELISNINNFFQVCIQYGVPPNKSGLCLALGITRETYRDWKNGRNGFSDIIKKAEQLIEQMTMAQAEAGITNNIVAIFKLKSDHGYKEANELTIKDGGKVKNSDEEQRLLEQLNQ